MTPSRYRQAFFTMALIPIVTKSLTPYPDDPWVCKQTEEVNKKFKSVQNMKKDIVLKYRKQKKMELKTLRMSTQKS